MKKRFKELRYILKKMIEMAWNPLTKWVVILWLCMYMGYIFYIFDSLMY